MAYVLPLVVGFVVVLGGLAILVFNRQFVALVYPWAQRVPQWQPILRTRPYTPRSDGRVPILMVIGAGWVLVGGIFVWAAVTGQT